MTQVVSSSLSVCKPTWYLLLSTVMVCVHKNAQVLLNHITNGKTDQQARVQRGAMVPRHIIKNSLVRVPQKYQMLLKPIRRDLSFSWSSNNHIQYAFVVTTLHEIEAIDKNAIIKNIT